MTKVITPDLIKIDDSLFYDKAEESLSIGKAPKGRTLGHTKESKTRACILATCLGSISRAAHLTGISAQTILRWKQEAAWWPQVQEQVEQIRNDLLAAKLTEVVENATDQILDRIQNGDEVYDYQSGETKRVPVPMKVLGDVGLKTALEKREELRGRGSIGTTKKDVVEHLKRLADAFETMVNKSNEKVINVEGEIVS